MSNPKNLELSTFYCNLQKELLRRRFVSRPKDVSIGTSCMFFVNPKVPEILDDDIVVGIVAGELVVGIILAPKNGTDKRMQILCDRYGFHQNHLETLVCKKINISKADPSLLADELCKAYHNI